MSIANRNNIFLVFNDMDIYNGFTPIAVKTKVKVKVKSYPSYLYLSHTAGQDFKRLPAVGAYMSVKANGYIGQLKDS